jgi:quercetin dioxygenase-like cupin family protein
MAAVLQFLKGEAELTLGSEKRNVRAGALVHMAPGLSHGIIAKTPRHAVVHAEAGSG